MELSNIIFMIFVLAFVVGTGFFVYWMKAKATTEQQEQVKTILRMLMGAAEVYFTSDQGAEKKQWVIDKLEEYGIRTKDVGSLIEGMYRQLLAEKVIGD